MKIRRKLISFISVLSFALIVLSITSCNGLANSNNESTEEPTEEPTQQPTVEPTEGLEFTLLEDGSSYSVTGIGTATDTDIIIPSFYNNKPVTNIDEWAFAFCSSLTSITIPDSVTSIGDGAFGGCESLESIVVDSDNKYYDSRNNCNAIIETATNTLITGCKNTTIPDSVTSIGDGAFIECVLLKNITIPDSVTSIGMAAFECCISLTSVTIGNGVTSIGDGAFGGCESLESIIIPDGVTSIGDRTFVECSSLTNVTIPNGVTSIGDGAFSYCSSLTSIVIPDSVTRCYQAFAGCDSLETVYYTGTKEQFVSVFGHGVSYTEVFWNTTITIIYNYEG